MRTTTENQIKAELSARNMTRNQSAILNDAAKRESADISESTQYVVILAITAIAGVAVLLSYIF